MARKSITEVNLGIISSFSVLRQYIPTDVNQHIRDECHILDCRFGEDLICDYIPETLVTMWHASSAHYGDTDQKTEFIPRIDKMRVDPSCRFTYKSEMYDTGLSAIYLHTSNISEYYFDKTQKGIH